MTKPIVICLTPVKNEAWILERFLKCASVWADHIIIADQGSDDGSREIARKFSKVLLIENEAKEYNELERQKLLLDAARAIPGDKLLIALDADEFLTANFQNSREWEMVLRAVPGTVIIFRWACVLPDRKSYFVFPADFPLGFMDDGANHVGKLIHSPRLPVPDNAARIHMSGIMVLHLSTIDWGRYTSKIRWYQAWELLQGKWDKKLFGLYRFYHTCFHIQKDRIAELPPEWTEGYGPGISILDVPTESFYRWDREMLDFFREHGAWRFRRLNLWNVDWIAMHRLIFHSEPSGSIADPRSKFDHFVHWWLEKTLPYHSLFPSARGRLVKHSEWIVRKIASLAGW